MKITLIASTLALSLVGASALRGQVADTSLEPMPEQLEMRWALSALPPAMRQEATVYLLDPAKGYRLYRQGRNGMSCLVERTAWELADFRNDIYIPLCYDAAGARTLLRVKMDAAALRARGMSPEALKTEMEVRYLRKAYRVPAKAGLAYMTAPIFRTIGPPDLDVRTMAMPHLMFYAPFVTNDDIAAAPDLADPASLAYPFIDRQGIAEQSYMIQMLGDAERDAIVAREKTLLDDLCSYRTVLCLPGNDH